MDAVELLIRQHRALEEAFSEALRDGLDEGARASRFAGVADLLTIHLTAEEQIFYPAVNARRTQDILLESLEEHLSLKRLLADLLPLSPSQTTFEPKLKVLAEQAEHHHKEEENHLFPSVLRLLDDAQRDALGSQMYALERQLLERGNPRLAVRGQTGAAEPLR